MSNQIDLIITTDNCNNNNEPTGQYRNGDLVIHITTIPKLVFILVDQPISTTDVHCCLNLLCEKLCACEELVVECRFIRVDNPSRSYCLIGGLTDENTEECIIAIHYQIVYHYIS